MQIEVSKNIRITGAPPALAEEVKSKLTFPNPAYQEAQRIGRWVGKIPRVLRAYEEDDKVLVVPRGFGRRFLAMTRYHQVLFDIEDRTRGLPEVPFSFKGALRPFQEEAVASILSRPIGTLSAPTGSGKTVMALAVIAERKQPALIIVHTKELLHQWIDRIEAFRAGPSPRLSLLSMLVSSWAYPLHHGAGIAFPVLSTGNSAIWYTRWMPQTSRRMAISSRPRWFGARAIFRPASTLRRNTRRCSPNSPKTRTGITSLPVT